MTNLDGLINKDVLEFFSSSEKFSNSGKIDLLTILLRKYAVLGTAEVVLDKKDLDHIISRSKQVYGELPMPIEIFGSDLPVNQVDAPSLCLIEATISHLNKLDCFKKVAKFNYLKR